MASRDKISIENIAKIGMQNNCDQYFSDQLIPSKNCIRREMKQIMKGEEKYYKGHLTKVVLSCWNERVWMVRIINQLFHHPD